MRGTVPAGSEVDSRNTRNIDPFPSSSSGTVVRPFSMRNEAGPVRPVSRRTITDDDRARFDQVTQLAEHGQTHLPAAPAEVEHTVVHAAGSLNCAIRNSHLV